MYPKTSRPSASIDRRLARGTSRGISRGIAMLGSPMWLAALFCCCLSASGWAAQRLKNDAVRIASQLHPSSRLDGSKRLRLAMALPLRNTQQLGEFLHDAYTPASGNYRKFLTPAQFAERFGPAREDYEKLITFARANGLTVTGTHSNRTILDVEGAVSDIEKSFHVKMQVYRHPTESREFYAPDTDPTADAPVALLRISGMDNYSLPRPHLKTKVPILKPAVAGN